MQYNPYLWPNCRNFRVCKEIGVAEHDGDVRFKSGSGNMAVLCMRNASGYNYRNNSFTVDLAIGPIPRSTERISRFVTNFVLSLAVKEFWKLIFREVIDMSRLSCFVLTQGVVASIHNSYLVPFRNYRSLLFKFWSTSFTKFTNNSGRQMKLDIKKKNQFPAQQHERSQLTTKSTKQILHTVIPRQKFGHCVLGPTLGA